MELTLALGSLAAVLIFAMVRPRGWPEAVVALPAAALLIGTGVVSWDAAREEIAELLPVVGFLAAVLVLAKLCDDEGLFHAAGVAMARRSRGRPLVLLIAVFVIASVTTAVLSLDATIVLLTPVVLATARTLRVPARPHAYATAHLANTASLLLPMSNLTNLLAFGAAGVSFLHFTSLMALPWVLAIAAEFVLLRLVFRRELGVRPESAAPPPSAEIPVFVLVVLAMTLVGFVVTSGLGVAPAWAALAGVLVLAAHGLARGRTTPAGIVDAANIPFLVFVLCLGVVVTGVTRHGLGDALHGLLPSGTGLVELLAVAAIAALLSNVVNNLPAVLVLLPLVAGDGPATVLAVLIGVNVGPNLTYPGSLSNLLWRNAVRRDSMPSGFVEFSRVGLLTTPVTLVVAVCGLWAGIQLVGT